MESYEKMLESAFKKIKPVESKSERFEVPDVESLIEGNKTIVSNFMQICNYLRRTPNHLEKFLQRELAAPSKMEGSRIVFVKKIPGRKLNEKIRYYVEKFVICKECRKPDTEIIKQDNFMFIHCLACGAKHSIAKI